MTLLAGKHAFVSGASRGIGAAIAAQLEQAGARVTRTARHAREGVLACDVTSTDQVAATMTEAACHHGPIQILVNNAGIGKSAAFLKSDSAMLDAMLDVNLKGAWHCSQHVLPGMLAAGWGRIVNIASLAGLEGFPYVSAYCASKHALVGLTRSMSAEYAGRGIAISAICPGYTDSDMLMETITHIVACTGMSPEQARAKVAAFNPDKRILSPDQVALVVLEHCLSETNCINGCIAPIPLPTIPSEAPT